MPIPLAILWHQHQPYYKDLASGELVMPWARLHGLKDYYGMARLLELCPGMRATINLVPSLVAQLLDYVECGATDPFLRRTRMPADALTEEDAKFILDHFFMAQLDRMVRVHPRYRELLELRRFGRRPAAAAARDFGVQDLRDLQVWFTLAWFHPLCFEEFEALRALRRKQRDFTEADKIEMLRAHDAVLARVLPLHRELQKRGQVELTTTPFYHPILPLLCDMECARVAMPRNPLPAGYRKLPEDAEAHVAKAVDLHRRVFGEAPRGMWPAEGSVSPELIPLVARYGIRWIATDEEILAASLGVGLRGASGRLDRPDLLYRPWRVKAGDAEVAVVFRDHQFSDLIGFQYQGWDGEAAALDLLAHVEAAAREAAGPERLATIILDGENCWEHYPEQGVQFLRTLYARLADGAQGVEPVRIGDFLAAHPPTRSLDKLFPGSWINHDFYIWIGHRDDRKAWEYVFRVREDLVAETYKRGQPVPFLPAAPGAGAPDTALAQAWEELYIAEGSDWCWWYGDDHTSGNDEAFDSLFRTHLRNVYTFLKLPPPYFLDNPISSRRAAPYTLPRAALRVILDGRVTSYFEWLGAGTYRSARDAGVMTASGPPLVTQVLFGYDQDHLCVRVDPCDEPRAWAGASATCRLARVALLFTEPKGLTLIVEKGAPPAVRCEGAWAAGVPPTQASWDEILELRLPLGALGLSRGRDVAFFVDATDSAGAVERFPRTGALQFNVPTSGEEDGDWNA